MLAEQPLLRAARRLLKPLVRLALRNGVAADAVTELVRKLYVDVAEAEFAVPGKKQTTSRISVLTGLSRKEVARLRALDPEEESEPRWRNRAATVLSAWELDPAFQDRKGDPLELPFVTAPGEPSFTELVRRHSGDMQPRAVADELLRVDAIEAVDDRLRMCRRGYEPAADPEAKLAMLGTDVSELIETIDHNLTAAPEETLLQGKVRYDRVPQAHAVEFLDYSRRLARNLLGDLNRWLRARDLDTPGADPAAASQDEDVRTVALGLGVYHIQEPHREDGDPQPRKESTP
ncbi:MAG: DUF6502 family protein [Pseudomonadota bacterium]